MQRKLQPLWRSEEKPRFSEEWASTTTLCWKLWDDVAVTLRHSIT